MKNKYNLKFNKISIFENKKALKIEYLSLKLKLELKRVT